MLPNAGGLVLEFPGVAIVGIEHASGFLFEAAGIVVLIRLIDLR